MKRCRSESVERAAHAFLADVRINHRRADIGMAKQFLHRANIVAQLQQELFDLGGAEQGGMLEALSVPLRVIPLQALLMVFCACRLPLTDFLSVNKFIQEDL